MHKLNISTGLGRQGLSLSQVVYCFSLFFASLSWECKKCLETGHRPSHVVLKQETDTSDSQHTPF